MSARSRRIYIYIELIIHINATPYVISVTKSVKIPFRVTTSISEVERPRAPRPCGQESYHRTKAAPPPPEPSLPAQLHFPQQLSFEGERPPHPSNRPGSSPPRVRRARRRSRSPVPGEPRPIARVFSRRERSAWKRRGELTAASPSLPYLPQHHGVQGRFHLLLHLRVRQRGSPRQARGPGARPIDGLLMSLATRAHRPSVADRSIRRPATRRRRDLRIAHRLTDRLPPSSSPPITDLRCRARRVPRRGPRLQGARARREPEVPPFPLASDADRRNAIFPETAVARGRASRPRAAPRPTRSPFFGTRANRLDRARPRPPPPPPTGPSYPRSAPPRNPAATGGGGGRHSACAFRVLFYLFFYAPGPPLAFVRSFAHLVSSPRLFRSRARPPPRPAW